MVKQRIILTSFCLLSIKVIIPVLYSGDGGPIPLAGLKIPMRANKQSHLPVTQEIAGAAPVVDVDR